MALIEISLKTLKEELKDKRVRLIMGDSEDNTVSPIRLMIEFDKAYVDFIVPECVCFYGDCKGVGLLQIERVFKDDTYEKGAYIIKCGKTSQTNMEIRVECL